MEISNRLDRNFARAWLKAELDGKAEELIKTSELQPNTHLA